MSTLSKTFSYSVGKKLIMGLTGLFLIIFLVAHLAGNLLLYVGPEAFNAYAEFMGHNVLIRTMEIVLFAGFIFHIVDGILLTLQNQKARPVRYVASAGNKNSSLSSRIMPWTGMVMLVFLVLHLVSFFFLARLGVEVSFGADSANYMGAAFGEEGHSLYDKVVTLFAMPWYAIFNAACMAVVAFHLLHGFQSAFQTMGINHKKYTPAIKAIGIGYAILIPAAFASIPIYFMLCS